MSRVNSLIDSLSSIDLPCEIFYGVNGSSIIITDTADPFIKQLDLSGDLKLYNRRVRINGEEMRRGEFGCAWSHHRIYEKLVADETADSYLVLEDDAESTVTPERLTEYIQNLPETYDICRTTESQWYSYRKSTQLNPYYYTYDKRFSNHTTSYIVSKSGAQKILQFMNNHIEVPADDLLAKIYMHVSDFIAYASEESLFNDPGAVLSIIDSM